MERRYNPYMPIWFALVLAGGMLIGLFLGNRFNNIMPGRATGGKLPEILRYVQKNYVDTIGFEQLEEKAINGFLEKLDPHSVYISAAEFHEANDPLLGSFEGIGVQFRVEKDTVVVIIPIAGGPSEKVGIRAGDRIVKVNGENIAGIKISTNDVMRKLKGPKGTEVTISVFRRNTPGLVDFVITRDVIPTYSLDVAYMAAPAIGYIRLNNFSSTTARETSEALEKLLGQGMKKLILDLRGNGGGYLKAAIDVADQFLPEGKLIVYTNGIHRDKEVANATSDGLFESGELVVLVDEGTASSAEIVAGAIQDQDRGTIIGRRTFGKGLVQEQKDFKDGSALRLTVAKYYTPTGRCIQKPYDNGIEDYHGEFYQRMVNGELEHPDSIKFPDSLKYKTPGGKIVYGGGGIMPDIFIPVERDSTLAYYSQCINKGIVYQFAFDYTDRYRSSLGAYRDVKSFEKNFVISDLVYKEFIRFAETKGVKRDGKDNSKSDRYIRTMLKAYIGRNLLDNNVFFPIINSIDPGYLKSIETLNLKP